MGLPYYSCLLRVYSSCADLSCSSDSHRARVGRPERIVRYLLSYSVMRCFDFGGPTYVFYNRCYSIHDPNWNSSILKTVTWYPSSLAASHHAAIYSYLLVYFLIYLAVYFTTLLMMLFATGPVSSKCLLSFTVHSYNLMFNITFVFFISILICFGVLLFSRLIGIGFCFVAHLLVVVSSYHLVCFLFAFQEDFYLSSRLLSILNFGFRCLFCHLESSVLVCATLGYMDLRFVLRRLQIAFRSGHLGFGIIHVLTTKTSSFRNLVRVLYCTYFDILFWTLFEIVWF